ncbi:antitoxin Xre-like helix-turn-helix domain-containing protein [Pseudomonas sp. BP01]|uniref:antitoxin Xre-like helix-turn-helix domain-containing protein n=1 Tax=Pseudomonas sp. BP01 TaxID=2976152 RepID=UPI001FA9C0B5|nr:antitoxin Xre-like helix-turn-helix domain-containing protein [Pseudomonas sp. BP01]
MSRGPLTQNQSSIGLKVALRIVSTWRATPGQACKILRISPSTFRRASREATCGSRLDLDQQQRIGLVLGIHAQLRVIFSNPENVQGFASLRNFNAFFEGRSPLDVMAQGDMISLYETYKRIEQLHCGDVMAGQVTSHINS